jgi:hypothetical protein
VFTGEDNPTESIRNQIDRAAAGCPHNIDCQDGRHGRVVDYERPTFAYV